jgi:D-glycero-alpha-D-manno-heptose 1-phosphate guanylyltransferase
MKKQAVILAGGFGTRLKSVVPDLPKPMALINEIPFLTYLLDLLQKHHFEKIVLAAGYKSEAIESHFGFSYKNINLIYSIESEPLGTGGAISAAGGLISTDYFFVLNGDTLFDINFERMEEKFLNHHNGLMVALKPMENFERYGTVGINDDRIVSFNEKRYCRKGLINGGTYLLSKEWLDKRAPGKKYSFEKDILEKVVDKESVGYYISDGYFIDIGVPEDYIKAGKELPDLLYR